MAGIGTISLLRRGALGGLAAQSRHGGQECLPDTPKIQVLVISRPRTPNAIDIAGRVFGTRSAKKILVLKKMNYC